MLNLDHHNVLVQTLLQDRIQGTASGAIDQIVSDFDGVTFHISTPESKTRIMVSMSMRCFKDLEQYGVQDVLRREYGDMIVDPEEGYEFSVVLDLEKLSELDAEQIEQLVRKLAMMKRNALAAPFEKAMLEQKKLSQEAQSDDVPPVEPEIMAIRYREEEAIYVIPTADRVTVIFSTIFREETDRIFGKVFLQEFVDARRRPAIQNAPQVRYSYRDPPLELRSISSSLGTGEDVGYVTFTLFPRHYAQSVEQRDDCISLIQVFRNTLHYHIKASKAYMHQRMRARVADFLKVLNRAKPENSAATAGAAAGTTERKTASGRTFRVR